MVGVLALGCKKESESEADAEPTEDEADADADADAADAAAASSFHTFQKRSVSSAAAVTMVVPSGDCAMCSTREVCPVSSATLTIDGYFHKHSWLCE